MQAEQIVVNKVYLPAKTLSQWDLDHQADRERHVTRIEKTGVVHYLAWYGPGVRCATTSLEEFAAWAGKEAEPDGDTDEGGVLGGGDEIGAEAGNNN